MADIPVERRSGGGWWKWLLGLALLALVIWLVAELANTEEGVDETVEDPTEQTEEQPIGEATPGGAEGPITSLAAITTTANQEDVVGRDVRLSNLNVTSVVGDGAFYVSADNDDEQVLVVLDEGTQVETGDAGADTGAGSDGQINVNEGQAISTLEGAVERMDEAALSERGLDNTQAADEAFYIQAERISISSATG